MGSVVKGVVLLACCLVVVLVEAQNPQNLAIIQELNVSDTVWGVLSDDSALYVLLGENGGPTSLTKMDFDLNNVGSMGLQYQYFTYINETTALSFEFSLMGASANKINIHYYSLKDLAPMNLVVSVSTSITPADVLYLPSYSKTSVFLVFDANPFKFGNTGIMEVDFTTGKFINKFMLPSDLIVRYPFTISSSNYIGFLGNDSTIYFFDAAKWTVVGSISADSNSQVPPVEVFTTGAGDVIIAQIQTAQMTLDFISMSTWATIAQVPVPLAATKYFQSLSSDGNGIVYLAATNGTVPFNSIAMKCQFDGTQVTSTDFYVDTTAWVGGYDLGGISGTVHAGDWYTKTGIGSWNSGVTETLVHIGDAN